MATAITIAIAYLGQSCFLLETPQCKILIDPYGPKVGYAEKPLAADIVLVSHEHFDHNYVQMAEGKPVVLRGLKDNGADWNNVNYQDKGVKITTIPVYHDKNKGAERGKNAMFLIETNGLRILHTGDLGHVLTADQIKAAGRVDMLLICVGGFYTIDAKEAQTSVSQLKPRVVIPMHFKTGAVSLPISDNSAFLNGYKDVRTSDNWRAEFPLDLAAFPKDQTTIFVMPYRK